MQIDLLAPFRLIESIVRRGVARAVSNGIRAGVADGFQDALGLNIEVEPSELPALEDAADQVKAEPLGDVPEPEPEPTKPKATANPAAKAGRKGRRTTKPKATTKTGK